MPPPTEGYRRDSGTSFRLALALYNVLAAHPEQRLGQILINLWRPESGERDLWEIRDERWIEMLKWTEKTGECPYGHEDCDGHPLTCLMREGEALGLYDDDPAVEDG